MSDKKMDLVAEINGQPVVVEVADPADAAKAVGRMESYAKALSEDRGDSNQEPSHGDN